MKLSKEKTKALEGIAKKIDDMDDTRVHDFLRKNRFTPEEVGRIAEPLRGKIFDILDNPPWKAAEISRLMDNPNS